MMDWLMGCGIFHGPACPDGAAAQQASADYFRRRQMEMLRTHGDGVVDATAAMHAALNALAPTPEQRAEDERYYATRRHVEHVRVTHGLDWAFWYWLCGMGAALAIFRSLIHH